MFYNGYPTRGEIYYISAGERDGIGTEMRCGDGRPAIIVSNDMCNKTSPSYEVVYLTTKEKKDLPTHVVINSSKYRSTAICEQITTVFHERVGDYVGTCTDEEMAAIDEALAISIGLQMDPVEEEYDEDDDYEEVDYEKDAQYCDWEVEIAKLTAERDAYKSMVDMLLEKSIRG